MGIDQHIPDSLVGGRTATLKDVARAANVDPSTASRILRDDPAQVVRPDTRRRVLVAAESLGYRANASARSLRTGRSDVIGLLIPDLDNVGFTDVTHGVQSAAAEAGYLVMLIDAHALQQNEKLYGRLVFEGRLDGLLVAFARVDDRLAAHLTHRGIPLVLVNRRAPGVPASVVVDDQLGARMAIDHLAALGHRRIGHITGARNTDTSQRRELGYREALAEHGLRYSGRWLAEGLFTEQGGRAAAISIMARSNGQMPSAIFVSNLVSALGAIQEFTEAGIRVPEDLSVIAMDDHWIAAHTDPPMTCVAMPLFQMGAEAARMLIGSIRGEPGRHLVIDDVPTIVARGSTCPPALSQAEAGQ